jgi:hypothetical protein
LDEAKPAPGVGADQPLLVRARQQRLHRRQRQADGVLRAPAAVGHPSGEIAQVAASISARRIRPKKG